MIFLCCFAKNIYIYVVFFSFYLYFYLCLFNIYFLLFLIEFFFVFVFVLFYYNLFYFILFLITFLKNMPLMNKVKKARPWHDRHPVCLLPLAWAVCASFAAKWPREEKEEDEVKASHSSQV